MKVGLKGGRRAAENDISALEAAISRPLDAQFRSFVEINNGAVPESNSFPVGGQEHMGGVMSL